MALKRFIILFELVEFKQNNKSHTIKIMWLGPIVIQEDDLFPRKILGKQEFWIYKSVRQPDEE